MSNRASSLQVEVALTQFSIGFQPQDLIAEQLLPVVTHNYETGVFWEWDQQEQFTIPDTLTADGARPGTVDVKAKKNSFAVEQYSIDAPITDREERNADSILRLRQSKTRRAQETILLDQERRVAKALRENLPGKTLLAGEKWSDPANDAIEEQVDDAKEAIRLGTMGREPNTIVIPRRLTRYLKRNPAIRELIKYTAGDLLVNGELPPVLWGMRVLIPGAITNVGTSVANYQDVWGDDIVLAHVSNAPELDAPSLGYIIRNGQFTTYTWRDDSISTNYVRPTVLQTEKITWAAAGYVLKGAA